MGSAVFYPVHEAAAFITLNSYHYCDSGSSSNPASYVTRKSGGSTAAEFDMTVNKHLACCSAYNLSPDPSTLSNPVEPNEYSGSPSSASGAQKFDCKTPKDNWASNPDFEALWQATDGLNPLATVLIDGDGKFVTGFYELSGKRCDEFTEVVRGSIPSGTITINSRSQESYMYTGAISMPSNAGWVSLVTAFKAARPALRLPNCSSNGGAECKRCPILVRAVTKAYCPGNTGTLTYQDSLQRHCSVAESIQIHLKIQQIYQINGAPNIKTIDTTVNALKPYSVQVSELLQ